MPVPALNITYPQWGLWEYVPFWVLWEETPPCMYDIILLMNFIKTTAYLFIPQWIEKYAQVNLQNLFNSMKFSLKFFYDIIKFLTILQPYTWFHSPFLTLSQHLEYRYQNKNFQLPVQDIFTNICHKMYGYNKIYLAPRKDRKNG